MVAHRDDSSLDYDVREVERDHRPNWRASDGQQFCAECNVEWPCAVERVVRRARKYEMALEAIQELPVTETVESEAHRIALDALRSKVVTERA